MKIKATFSALSKYKSQKLTNSQFNTTVPPPFLWGALHSELEGKPNNKQSSCFNLKHTKAVSVAAYVQRKPTFQANKLQLDQRLLV